MGFFQSIQRWFVTTEADIEKFIEDVWEEVPIAAGRLTAVGKWIANVGFPSFKKDLDAAMPFMIMVGNATGHPELNASLLALQTATNAVGTALGSAQAGTLTPDQLVAAAGALNGAKSTFMAAKAQTAAAVAAAPMEGVKK